MRKIEIFDTTLRDGEQTAGVNLNTAEKIEIAKRLERLGVDVMEAGFPAASKGDLDAVKKVASIVKNSTVTALARSNRSDIDYAWEALKDSSEPRLHVFIATSPIHMTYKLKKTPDQVVEAAVGAVKYAKEKFPVVQWSAEDACRSDLVFLSRIVEKVIDAGATVINIPDTVGFTNPEEYGKIFRYLLNTVPNIEKAILSAHCHDDLGMAVANSLSAIENGANQIECTINGIGERAGNASLEEIAVALAIREDFYKVKTNLTLNEISRTSQLVSRLTGIAVPPNKAVVGKNAFAHESGIHQDGVLKEKSTYEIITPELVGVPSNQLVLGKHSGRHAFKDYLHKLGFHPEESKVNVLFEDFKQLADRKKEMTEEDIFALLIDHKIQPEVPLYQLKDIQVNYGTNQIPTATLRLLTPDGTLIQDAATGSGSVEAIYNTLGKMLPSSLKLNDYRIQSVGAGRDALAQVFVQIVCDGHEINGSGTAQDVLEASAKAYVHAFNKLQMHSSDKKSYERMSI
ncbi:2-isopropylmalate synthase [Fictibacillus barbaricus]|uniref:2-isopropylmalate synthase n=1 Tax=Fictibacillus barbaricus TaxID=182136 RepID=A0ABS2ZL49_9BACL|nr:2-isopropylmalate synthase [Fictibacillus barbaricus]MBN3547430.1 2-isopropylmalate synthase [Fictibacillus barbaricus]GGB48921.1 2-isopropylmalate synthase [Fictibacillus barbaricus]